jgi:mono/diheme cytochrome c family protein
MQEIKRYIGAAGLLSVLMLTGCSRDPRGPGFEYMPNMYRSPSYETYAENPNSPTGSTAREPVKGTVTIDGDLPYPYADTPEDYEKAGLGLRNPIIATPAVIEEGKQLFIAFCSHCHGETGAGDGSIVNNQKFPPPPSFQAQLKALPEGKMFHSITYGKNLMGSHASQLSQPERWKIVHYLKELQKL